MLTENYAHILTSAISNICRDQAHSILQAAQRVADVIAADGLIYVFGCGHSHMLAEETFYRAGGLACVSPIFYEPLMLHESAAQSSLLEKQNGLAATVFDQYEITTQDLLICVSTSGVNAVPVEFAQHAKSRGIPVIAITSSAYNAQTPHNVPQKHLYQCCDVWIDNKVPHGDACLSTKGLPISMTPVSTITSCFIINSILAEGTQIALQAGNKVPIYLSGNIPGGAEFNNSLVQRYKSRIRYL